MRSFWRFLSLPVVLGGLSLSAIVHCDGGKQSPKTVGPIAAACPEMTPEAVAKFDFAKEWNLEGARVTSLRSELSSAIVLKDLATRADTEVFATCTDIAKDLGGTGDWKTADEACGAAVKAIQETRAKLGAKVDVVVGIVPPVCETSFETVASCLAACDSSYKPPLVEKQCDARSLRGACGGTCEGTCDAEGAFDCKGECTGACDKLFSGMCGGKRVAYETCAGGGVGTCGGKCTGSCSLKKPARCSGTCTGTCSVERKSLSCTGKVDPGETRPECRAQCGALLASKAPCKPAMVTVATTAVLPKALKPSFDAFKVAVEKNLPKLLRLSVGMKGNLEDVADHTKKVADAAMSGMESQSQGDKPMRAEILRCVADPFKGVATAAAKLQATLGASAQVVASVSAKPAK